MRVAELELIAQLRTDSYTVSELAEAIGKSQNWTSELVADLEDQNLIKKNRTVELVDNYETRLLAQLMDEYDLESVLKGKKEDILEALLDSPKTISELQVEGFAKSTVYDAVNEFQTRGVVERLDDDTYRITDDTLREYLRARSYARPQEYTADGGRIKTDTDDGQLTAFSAFQRYGVDYYPKGEYRFQGDRDPGLEDVLMHAVRVAETKKQMAMCGVFLLKHRDSLDTDELWKLANEWDCIEKWADIQAFLDQRETQNGELFLPWGEFTDIARDYDVYPRGKHPGTSLLDGLDELGDQLERDVNVYLLGGGNLILRDLKDSTKDIDVVVDDEEDLFDLTDSLQNLGYEERRDLEEVYKQMNPSIVLERQGSPRWDTFLDVVADNLHLTDGMKARVDETRRFSNLTVHLLSLTDIFLFKTITEREGDLEDTALIARQADLNWEELFEELKTQENSTDQMFSFAVLDTLDLLKERHDIQAPIHDDLVSYCLENALMLSLEEGAKTIRDLREEFDHFPDHRIYNKLRKLENQGLIEVDRTGKLNEYSRVSGE